MIPKDTWNKSSVISISVEVLLHHGTIGLDSTASSQLKRGSPLYQKPRLVGVGGSVDLRDFGSLFIAA